MMTSVLSELARPTKRTRFLSQDIYFFFPSLSPLSYEFTRRRRRKRLIKEGSKGSLYIYLFQKELSSKSTHCKMVYVCVPRIRKPS